MGIKFVMQLITFIKLSQTHLFPMKVKIDYLLLKRKITPPLKRFYVMSGYIQKTSLFSKL